MSGIASRAEAIGARLVSHALGATASEYDVSGRQSAMDFLLTWPDGPTGALEITLVTRAESSAWQGMAAAEGWRWPASSAWEFRLAGADMPYRQTRRAVLRAVELCEQWAVRSPEDLHAEVLTSAPELELLWNVGRLRRSSPHGPPGVVLHAEARAEFLESASPDFALVVEHWLDLPHVPRHIEKLRLASDVEERHLFLGPVDEVLPARFFTNDFPAPDRGPGGYGALDGVWIWSNYWHQYLGYINNVWSWYDFPEPEPEPEPEGGPSPR